MSKRDRNWDQVKWTPFERVEIEKPLGTRGSHALTFVNSIYQVEVEGRQLPPPLGNAVWLSMKTRDRQPRHNWREMQQVKNEVLTLLGFVGERVEAVELFPDEDRLVDTCNQFHLWCFPFLAFPDVEPGRFPFGYKERIVSEGSMPGAGDRLPGCARQTDFRPELRPLDTLSGDATMKLPADAQLAGRCPICGSTFVREAGGFWCLKSNHYMPAQQSAQKKE